ncbi:carbohydrate kinase family protein [Halovivax gelatinilyticus]|uniref:carbohydrate kinase family protein n=1 Tax=Halovivax gelatinilyticus TaxID=2961597 RepID=UPI0020CA9156|nr:PfkB family carbohydrate kinase [Halovivax gelatinilyticus]
MGRVLVAGHVNWDVTLRVDRLPEPDGEASIRDEYASCGGSGANVAASLSRLGEDVALYGSVGDDEYGDRAASSLESAGVDCTGVLTVSDAETARKYLLVDDDGAVSIVGDDGANEALSPADVDRRAVRRADHVHLTSQRPETAAAFASAAAVSDTSVSFDPGRRLAHRSYDETISHADVLFLTGREAELLGQRGDQAVALDGGITVLTDGGDGAAVYGPDGTVRHEGFDVTPVDTAGAGDAFAAGFLSKWRRDADVSETLRFANACGAIAATTTGSQPALSARRVERFLAAADGPM